MNRWSAIDIIGGISLILLCIVIVFFSPPMIESKAPRAVAAFILMAGVGTLYVVSYYTVQGSFILKVMRWQCENFSSPKAKGMAFFYAVFAFIIGGLSLVSGLGLL